MVKLVSMEFSMVRNVNSMSLDISMVRMSISMTLDNSMDRYILNDIYGIYLSRNVVVVVS